MQPSRVTHVASASRLRRMSVRSTLVDALGEKSVERNIVVLLIAILVAILAALGGLKLSFDKVLDGAAPSSAREGARLLTEDTAFVEMHEALFTSFVIAAVALSLLTLAAFAVPALAWYRSTKDKQVADRLGALFAEDAEKQHKVLEGMLANMPHGLCIFDSEKRLVLCNARYAEMYKLPPDVVRPGTALQDIIDYRTLIGNAPAHFPNYVTHEGLSWREDGNSLFEFPLLDGRAVRINHLALKGGGYVATHEDITNAELEASKTRAANELAESRAKLVEELERKNRELESFSYSVSHDLRTPLRAIDGFSHAVLEDCGDQLDETGKEHLRRIRSAATRMGELIDDILQLSRITRAEMTSTLVDLSALAQEVVDDLRRQHRDHSVELKIEGGLTVEADRRMMRIVLENLLGNAWKFTRRTEHPVVEFGMRRDGETTYFVRDNGAGFNMEQAQKLFQPFQRLHTEADFPGTGIGLATIHRVIDRHGGRVWAEAEVGRGATILFTIPEAIVEPLREKGPQTLM